MKVFPRRFHRILSAGIWCWVIPAHKITLMIVCVGINSRALKITIFARQLRKVSPKLYNLALPALLWCVTGSWVLRLVFSIVMTTVAITTTTAYRFRYLTRQRWTAITTAIQPMFLRIIVIAIRMAIKRHGSYPILFITIHSAIKNLA